jgi:hypothetical protein
MPGCQEFAFGVKAVETAGGQAGGGEKGVDGISTRGVLLGAYVCYAVFIAVRTSRTRRWVKKGGGISVSYDFI